MADTTTARPIDPEVVAQVAQVATAAKAASRRLAQLTRAAKDELLLAIADALVVATSQIVTANAVDLARGRDKGLAPGLLDRLMLDEQRITAIADAVRDVASLPDPVGEVVRGSTLANGLQIRQVRVPMGVLGMIYEARPNVTVDAAALALKSGNAVILRGGSAAGSSNRAIVDAMGAALTAQGLDPAAVSLLDQGGHDDGRALMTARGLVDLVIPRGGADLIATVVRESTVPVIETGTGVNHVYVDAGADLDEALAIVLNSKTQRTSVCNAAETMLVHEGVAEAFLPKVLAALGSAGVTVHSGPEVAPYAEAAGAAHTTAEEGDFDKEWYSLDLGVRVVPDIDTAMEHIARHGTMHTEVIVTRDRAAARRFQAEVDAAVVVVNASSRFTDGGEFGFGAEIGISTQKLHARGPMALAELTTTKWLVEGDGQVRV
ncbi:MAG: glutamate-5-semialdehyde dehydrogenase [Actinomycetota bacterium]|nr:glutamate-5-semialdehyde dehydrogenase [Actinomycetota bacterium]